MKKTSSQPFLKWVGGKRRLLPTLLPLLPSGTRLIEPFVGAGSVFLAAGFERQLLADNNPVLMALYQRVQTDVGALLAELRPYFTEANRSAAAYLAHRDTFNAPATPLATKAVLFVYLNKFGFNGLYRTNRRGECNTPYGHPARLPALPEAAILEFAEHLKSAELRCADFAEVMQEAQAGDVIYCDPPYADQADKPSFTAYGQAGFSWADQERLAAQARTLAMAGVTVVISNHDTPATRALYTGATLHALSVHRSIAGRATARGMVCELVAVFAPSGPARNKEIAVGGDNLKSGRQLTHETPFPLPVTPPPIGDLAAASLYPSPVTLPVMENPMSTSELPAAPAPELPALARQLGLRPVRAWVPDETTPKKTSSGAERTRRAREKAETEGVKQVSLAVPVKHHALLKMFAERTRAGEPAACVLTEMLQTIQPEPAPSIPVQPALPGWRHWLIRRLLPDEWIARLPLPHSRS